MGETDCPDELKILIADRITAYYAYIEAHAKLFNPQGSDDFALQTKLVIDNYKENRLIFEELNHYKMHRLILGKHPVFDWFKRAQEIRSMRVGDVVRTRANTINMQGKLKRYIMKNPHHKNTGKRKESIATLNKVLQLTTQILGI